MEKLGRLNGLSPKDQLTDDQIIEFLKNPHFPPESMIRAVSSIVRPVTGIEFPDLEAPTQEQRTYALECMNWILSEMATRSQLRSLPTPEEIKKLYKEYFDNVKAAWEEERKEPFPDFTLTHVLGATKRMFSTCREIREAEGGEDYLVEPLEILYNYQTLLEKTISENLPQTTSPK